MKRYGNLFEKIFTQENLYLAYLDARKGKRKKQRCFEFETNLSVNIENLYKSLHNNTYKPKPYFKFDVYEPKQREIHAPAFCDIVVQHAIYRIIYPIFNVTFIDTSFACRKCMGTHKASDYTQKCIRFCNSELYYLKCDIQKFFYSINRLILKSLLEKKIKDKRLINIMMLYTELNNKTGIPIGNLLSQLYALIYLNPLDHFVKRYLKIKNYVRYVDDFIAIGVSRSNAILLRLQVEKFISEVLKLSFSKTTIQKIRKGINFVGYRTWKSKRFIRKYSLYKFQKILKKSKLESIISLLGHAKQTNSILYMFNKIKEIGSDNIYQRTRRLFKLWKNSGWYGIET